MGLVPLNMSKLSFSLDERCSFLSYFHMLKVSKCKNRQADFTEFIYPAKCKQN